jgi:hypothetical protein
MAAFADHAFGQAKEEVTVVRCANCGSELGPQDRYCDSCGEPAGDARISHDGPADLALEDLQSTNGTQVNGERTTTPTTLRAADAITLGGATLVLEDECGRRGPTTGPASEPPPLLVQAWALRTSGRASESEELFRRLSADDRNAADAYYGLGYLARDRGDGSGAEAAFKAALASEPGHANALYELGALAEARGALQEARDVYVRVLAINPEHASAKQQLSQLELSRPQTPPLQSEEAPGPPNPPSRPDATYGLVSAVQQRYEQGVRQSTTVVTFRFARATPDGLLLPPIGLEMRGVSWRGSINPGDWIELPHGWRPSQRIRRATNLTSLEPIEMRFSSLPNPVAIPIMVFIIVWIVVLFGIVITSWVHALPFLGR